MNTEIKQEYDSNRREMLISNGICDYCAKEKAVKGRRKCEKCLEKARNIAKEERLFRKKHKLCSRCGREQVYGTYSMCYECYIEFSEIMKDYKKRNKSKIQKYIKDRREECASNGICTRCQKRSAAIGKKSCKVCLEKARSKYTRSTKDISRFERSAYGLCYLCGNSSKDGYKLCEKHYEMMKDNILKSRNGNNNNEIWGKENLLLFQGRKRSAI